MKSNITENKYSRNPNNYFYYITFVYSVSNVNSQSILFSVGIIKCFYKSRNIIQKQTQRSLSSMDVDANKVR
jgi:hypothetical protein